MPLPRLSNFVDGKKTEPLDDGYAELLDPWGAPFAVTAPAHHQVDLTLSFSALAGMKLTFGG